jgi:hypothetical protein
VDAALRAQREHTGELAFLKAQLSNLSKTVGEIQTSAKQNFDDFDRLINAGH